MAGVCEPDRRWWVRALGGLVSYEGHTPVVSCLWESAIPPDVKASGTANKKP